MSSRRSGMLATHGARARRLPQPRAAPARRAVAQPPSGLSRPRAPRVPPRPKTATSVTGLGAPANDELLERRAHALVDRRLLVALERRAPDLAGPLGGVAAAHPRPAGEILRRGQQRAGEALAKALERVHGAEEVSAGADLLVGAEGQARLV